ncbi:MAG: UDP-N-acetylmuramoyl-tripeptide--D-alanyl-D-alanine ligase [Anaerolineae bacterium]|jgi:UDP-N-acetylmuramoyl-tripeptide--D-alanyl-D-alanine ligase
MTARSLTLADVLEGLCGRGAEGLDQKVTATVIDSRDALPGAMFVAFEGEQADGHDYVADAFSDGAVVAIVEQDLTLGALTVDLTDERPTLPDSWTLPAVLRVNSTLEALHRLATYWRQSQTDLRVIGVTGSVGKTTTKELTAAVLARRYKTIKSEASYNNEIGLPLTLLHLTSEHERAVLEMGMYDMGEIADLARMGQPHVGVVTIVRPVHLEHAGSFERIVKAKTELVEALPPGPEGVAILNYDDENVRKMAASTRADVLTYGLSPEADVWADQIEGLGLEGIHFRLHHGDETLHVKVPLLGRHSVHTALRATAAGLVEELTWQEIIEGLRGVEPSDQLRLVAVQGPDGATILDDTYNASPASTIAALNLLDELEGRKIAVLGDMLELGDYEREGHEKVGMRALEVADVLVTVGSLGAVIGETALRWGMSSEAVHILEDREQAVQLLKSMVGGDDVILVKGSRALKMEEIVNSLSSAS